jgi:hypothetical protein
LQAYSIEFLVKMAPIDPARQAASFGTIFGAWAFKNDRRQDKAPLIIG